MTNEGSVAVPTQTEGVASALVSGHLHKLLDRAGEITKLDAESERKLADLASATHTSRGDNACG